MVRPRTQFAPSNASLQNAGQLGSVNFKHFLIGAILQARDWMLVQSNVSLDVVVRHYCQPLKLFSDQDLALPLMLKSYAPRRKSRRNSTIVASALLLHLNLVKRFVFVPRGVPGNKAYV